MELVLIAAVAEDGTIGDEGEMPWHYTEDLRRFREVTLGSPVIMGRRTYESIVERLGHALDGRTNIVLSSRPPADVVDRAHLPDDSTDVTVVASLDAALDRAERTGADTAYVSGGASVYEQCLPLADRLLITEVPGRYDGDTRFPEIDDAHWRVDAREVVGELVFVSYHRRDEA